MAQRKRRVTVRKRKSQARQARKSSRSVRGKAAKQTAAKLRPKKGPSKRPFRNWLSGVQLVEQGLSLLQVDRVEAFGEPAVDRREEITGFGAFALVAP